MLSIFIYYIMLYSYFIHISIEYELNINSLDISCDLVYEELYEYKSELQSSGGHDGQPYINTSYY